MEANFEFYLENSIESSLIENNSAFNAEISYRLFEHKTIVLKKYRDATTKQDRYCREISFLNHCRKLGIECVPRILAYDSKDYQFFMTLAPGETIKLPLVSDSLMYGNFILRINDSSMDVSKFLIAKDALNCGQDLLDDIDRRLAVISELDVSRTLSRKIDFLKSMHAYLIGSSTVFQDYIIHNNLGGSHILSPSDIGFHNALKSSAGLSFIDFEYSGLDSPIKMLMDFACQPKFSVSRELIDVFFKETYSLHGLSADSIPSEVWDLFRVKWGLIKMSSLLRKNEADDLSVAKEMKLNEYFKTHFYKHGYND
jgi:hypothetical protein